MPQETAATWSRIGWRGDEPVLQHPGDRVLERHPGAGDRRGAGAAIGLDDVAIDDDLALAQGLEVDHRPEAAADQPLDFLGAAGLLAGGGLAAHAFSGGARQHAVFGGDPAAVLALEPERHLGFDRGRAQDVGVAEAHQAGAFGMPGAAALQGNLAQLVRCASGGPHVTVPMLSWVG